MKAFLNILVLGTLMLGCQASDKKVRPEKAPTAQEVKKDEKVEAPKKEEIKVTNPPASPSKTKQKPKAKIENPFRPEKKPENSHVGEQNVDFVFLTPADLKEIAAVAFSYFGETVGDALSPYSANEHPAFKTAHFNGDLKKGHFEIEYVKADSLVFTNVKTELNKEGRGGFGEYSLLSMCVGSTCDKLIVLVYIREKGGFTYNLPLFFKKVDDGKYLIAYRKPGEEIPEDSLPQEKIPPQMKLSQKLAELYTENILTIIELIKNEMREADAVFSAYFFYNNPTRPGSHEFKKESDHLNFKVPIKNLSFAGVLKDRKVTVEHGDFSVRAIPVKGADLFVLVYDQKGFKALLPGENRGMSAEVCSILVENEATFGECVLVSSSEVAGTIALESKADGPIFVKEGEILDKLPPQK